MGQQACCEADPNQHYDAKVSNFSTPRKSRKQRVRDRLTSSSKYSPLKLEPTPNEYVA